MDKFNAFWVVCGIALIVSVGFLYNSVMGYVCNQQTTGLEAYYEFDEDLSPLAVDSAGCDHNGTFGGTYAYDSGTFPTGNSYDFNSGNVTIPNTLGGWDEITVEAWIEPDTLPTAGGIDQIVASENAYVMGIVESAGSVRLRADINDGSWCGALVDTTTNIQTGNQYHVAMRWDTVSNNLSLFINGSYTVSKSCVKGTLATPTSNRIASSSGNLDFLGKVDDVRIWNVSRTEAEIRDYYDQELNYTAEFVITIVNPKHIWYNRVAPLNVTTSSSVDSCVFNIDGGTNTSMNSTSGTNYFAEITGISYGQHEVNVFCTSGASVKSQSQFFLYNMPNLYQGELCRNITITEQGYDDIDFYSYPLGVEVSSVTPFWEYSARVFDENMVEIATDVSDCITNGSANWCNSATVNFSASNINQGQTLNYTLCYSNISSSAVPQSWVTVAIEGDVTDDSSIMYVNNSEWQYAFCRRSGQRQDDLTPEMKNPPKPVNVLCYIRSPDDPYNLLEDDNHSFNITDGYDEGAYSYISNQGWHGYKGSSFDLQDEDGNTSENRLTYNGTICKTHSFRWINDHNSVEYYINYTYCDQFPAILMRWESLDAYTSGSSDNQKAIGFSDSSTDSSSTIGFNRLYTGDTWVNANIDGNNGSPTNHAVILHDNTRQYSMGILTREPADFSDGVYWITVGNEFIGLLRNTSVTKGSSYTAYEFWLTGITEAETEKFMDIMFNPPLVTLDSDLNISLPPGEPTPGPESNITIEIIFDSAESEAISLSTCENSDWLRTDSYIRKCVGEEGNYTPNCYWINTSKLSYCAYGCYEDTNEFGDSCSPASYWIALLGFIILLVGIAFIAWIYGVKR